MSIWDRDKAPPPPLFKMRGGTVINEENQNLLDNAAASRSAILPGKLYRKYKKEYFRLNRKLQKTDADQVFERRKEARAAYEGYPTPKPQYYAAMIVRLHRLLLCYPLPIQINLVNRLVRIMRRDVGRYVALKNQVRKAGNEFKPFARDVVRRNFLKNAIVNHRAALADQKKEKELQEEKAQEAQILADMLSRELARLGFKSEETGRNGKTRTRYVVFDDPIVTPDQLWFPIKGATSGLFGGYRSVQPQGVKASDIVKPDVLKNLTSYMKRQVHAYPEGDDPPINGYWLVVETLGMVEGIMKSVAYSSLMARYDTATHEKMPMLVGIGAGRNVHWVNLHSHEGIHLMITGNSGHGKSNGMRAMISSLVHKQSPRDVVFAFIDLKRGGDFNEFKDAPHCLEFDGKHIIQNISDVADALQSIQRELYTRFAILNKSNKKSIADYNKSVSQAKKMPDIVVVFDEYANTRRAGYENQTKIIDGICTDISQLGRAAGIHLFIGIQQPTTSNMPATVRYNISTQIDGRQSTTGASMSVAGNWDIADIPNIPGRFSVRDGNGKNFLQMPEITESDIATIITEALQSFGHIPRYQLVDEAEAEEMVDAIESDEQFIIRLVITEMNCELKGTRIYERIKSSGRMTRRAVFSAIENVIDMNTVSFDGETYFADKQAGNWYKLVHESEYQTEYQTEYQHSA